MTYIHSSSADLFGIRNPEPTFVTKSTNRGPPPNVDLVTPFPKYRLQMTTKETHCPLFSSHRFFLLDLDPKTTSQTNRHTNNLHTMAEKAVKPDVYHVDGRQQQNHSPTSDQDNATLAHRDNPNTGFNIIQNPLQVSSNTSQTDRCNKDHQLTTSLLAVNKRSMMHTISPKITV
jgi:hypothetical protein